MFNYTIMFCSDPNYYEDFHSSDYEFKSITDALKDALSYVNEDSLKDCARIFVYKDYVDLVISFYITTYSLPILRKKFIS